MKEIKASRKEKLVYSDETWSKTQIFQQYARIPRGKRLNMRINGKRHARIDFGAIWWEGELIAPFTYGGRMTAPLFKQRFENKLLKLVPQDCIMDNASFHKKVLYRISKNILKP